MLTNLQNLLATRWSKSEGFLLKVTLNVLEFQNFKCSHKFSVIWSWKKKKKCAKQNLFAVPSCINTPVHKLWEIYRQYSWQYVIVSRKQLIYIYTQYVFYVIWSSHFKICDYMVLVMKKKKWNLSQSLMNWVEPIRYKITFPSLFISKIHGIREKLCQIV